MNYRSTAEDLFRILEAWDRAIKTRITIRLIACGGTALTLLGYKESTKDVDFLVPERKEYDDLTSFLEAAGYRQVTGSGWLRASENIQFDLFPGKTIFTTELLDSPLKKGGHRKIRLLRRFYIGTLNTIDLMISKLFRGNRIDFDDCVTLIKKENVNLAQFETRYKETASYDTSTERALKHLDTFLSMLHT